MSHHTDPASAPADVSPPPALEPGFRTTAAVLVLAYITHVVHQIIHSKWVIEDAAISYTYARMLTSGEGFVTWAGGERVEGFSNPLWVFLMAGWDLVGVDPFFSAKYMGLIFGSMCIPLTWLLAREALPNRPWAALLAPVILAFDSPFGLWNSSGLENPLFNVLLAFGAWRLLIEARGGGFPWSVLAFLGIALTRPEGILYGAWAGALGLLIAARHGRPFVWIGKWALAFGVPFAAWHAWRMSYFGWEFPATYYAKVGRRPPTLYQWSSRAWTYIRGWAHELGEAWLAPIYLLGTSGTRGWRFGVALVGLALFWGTIALSGPEVLKALPFYQTPTLPAWFSTARPFVFIGLLAALPWLAIGRDGWYAKLLCWGLAAITLFFTQYSTGDWMKGYRWLSMLAIPASVLGACGIDAVLDWIERNVRATVLQRRLSTAFTVGLVVALTAPEVVYSNYVVTARSTTPFAIKRRLDFFEFMQEKLQLDHASMVDGDMGAAMWFSMGRHREIIDYAGLVDIPISQHTDGWPSKFFKQYIYEEQKPEFIHIHGSWAKQTGLLRIPNAKTDYIEYPPFADGRASMVGMHVRRDVIFEPAWSGPTGIRASFGDALTIDGVDTTVPGAAGRDLNVEVGMQAPTRKVRVTGFIAGPDGVVASFDLPPAYDWLKVDDWGGQVFHGRFLAPIPAETPAGTYDFGLLVVDVETHEIIPANRPDGEVAPAPRFAAGEIVFPGAVRIEDDAERTAGIQAALDQTNALAQADDCDGASAAWHGARRRAQRVIAEREALRAQVAPQLAACLARRADTAEREPALVALEAARWWDHRQADVIRVGSRIGAELAASGEAARARGDARAAYPDLRDALRADPSLSHVRRMAEEERDKTLGIKNRL